MKSLNVTIQMEAVMLIKVVITLAPVNEAINKSYLVTISCDTVC